MLDIKLNREKPNFVRQRLATRGRGDEARIAETAALDEQRRKLLAESDNLKAERNKVSKEITVAQRTALHSVAPHACLFAVLLSLVATYSTMAATEVGVDSIRSISRNEHWLYVHLTKPIGEAKVCSISLISPFTPGLDKYSAVSRYGPPKTKIPPKNGAEYYVYETKYGVIKLGWEETADGSTSCSLYFIPSDKSPASFFTDEIVKQIQTNALKEVIMLFEPEQRRPTLHAVIENGQIREIVMLPKW